MSLPPRHFDWRWPVGVVLVLLAALILQSGLLAYAMYVLLGVVLLSRWLARDWLGKLTAVRDCASADLEVGTEFKVRVRIRNTGRAPIPWVVVEDLLPAPALRQRPPRLTVQGKRLKVGTILGGGELKVAYRVTFQYRGFYQVGPLVLESGDLFGLHRRHRVLTDPVFVLVYPKVIPLAGYDIASRRPVGEVRLVHRLFEDPTRNAGVRPYQPGDPLSRVHWRATARAGTLHSRVFDATTLAGATLLLNFHRGGYPRRSEPFRSELAVTTACSLANAVALLGQQVGLVTNGRDAVARIRVAAASRRAGASREDAGRFFRTGEEAREEYATDEEADRKEPLMVPTGRGVEQFQRIRETLARVELSDGLTLPQLAVEAAPRMPRDATVIAVLASVPTETAMALGELRRSGFAVAAVLVGMDEEERPDAFGRLAAEGVRDVRHVGSEEELSLLCADSAQRGPAAYSLAVEF
jgi:uncharacterized protein (DUF58 family)